MGAFLESGAAAEGMLLQLGAAAWRGIGGDEDSEAQVPSGPDLQNAGDGPPSPQDAGSIALDGQEPCGVLLRLAAMPQD